MKVDRIMLRAMSDLKERVKYMLECTLLTRTSKNSENSYTISMNSCDPDYWIICGPDVDSSECAPEVNMCAPDYGEDGCLPECSPNEP